MQKQAKDTPHQVLGVGSLSGPTEKYIKICMHFILGFQNPGSLFPCFSLLFEMTGVINNVPSCHTVIYVLHVFTLSLNLSDAGHFECKDEDRRRHHQKI